MTDPDHDSTISLTLPAMASPTLSTAHAEIEEQVIFLFDQLHDRLSGYLLSFSLTVYDADDIVQETFLALFRHLQLGRSRRNLRGWIFRVGHNLALKRRNVNQASGSNVAYDSIMRAHSDTGPSVEEQIQFSQRQKHLLAILAALPEQDQRCLCLRAEGLKYREIAEILGISLGTVSISLARSLARLTRSEGRE
jgi:RNA polymerase sigma-70 factor, ECF subfamily